MWRSRVTLDALIDFRLPEPNLQGIPLWMARKPMAKETEAVIAEAWRRGRAATHLAGYAAYTLDVVPALHHRVICEAIDGLLADEYDDLVINTPPGAAKSTYTSHALGAYFVGRCPTKNVILATHTADLSEKWSRKVRNTVADRRHIQLFPNSVLSKDSTAVGRWATTAGGEFLAAGVGASILGFRADLAIIDDPVAGFEQAQSETQLAKVHDWFETDLMTRLKPGGKIVTICQRLSANDLAGYMMERHAENPTRRLKVVVLKMEAEEGDAPDGTGRSPGDRLWPEWFTPEMVTDAKRDDYKWRTLYQQAPPSSSGDWVSADHIRIEDTTPDPRQLSMYLLTDLALSVNKGDYSVHIAAGVDHDGTIYVDDAWRDRCAIEVTARRHLDLCATYKPVESLIDDDNAAKVYVQLLASECRSRGTTVPWKTMPMRGQDKETRAAPLRGLFRSRRIVFKRAAWNSWLTREILTFPNAMGNGVDDGVDALGLIGRRLASLSRPSGPPAKLPPAPTLQQMTLDGLHDERERTHNAFSRRRI